MLAWGVKQQYLERNLLPEIQKLNEIRWVGQRPTGEIIDASSMSGLFHCLRSCVKLNAGERRIYRSSITRLSYPPSRQWLSFQATQKTARIVNTAHKVWEAAREAAGYPWLRIHDLCHACGIKLAEAGCPTHFISEVMGHHSIDYTRKQYAKFSPESASRAVLRILEGNQNGTRCCLNGVLWVGISS